MRRAVPHAGVLAALADGPGTCAELSAELGMQACRCAAHLERLVGCGRVIKSQEPLQLFGQRPAHLYALPEHFRRSA